MLRSSYERVVSAPRDIPLVTLVTGTVLGLLAGLLISGCAQRGEVRAEDREVPLTKGDENNARPYFSPDGQSVQFTSLEGPEGLSGTEIKIVPAVGGDPRTVSKESHRLGRGWDVSGKSIVEWNMLDREVLWVSEDGDLIHKAKAPEMSVLADLSPDGREVLWRQLTGNNLEMGLGTPDSGDMELIGSTPEWEIQGSFGPGPGQLTLVRQDLYSSTTNQILIWSKDGEDLLPIPEAKLRSPAWSPDKRYMAYASDQTGNMDLWIYEADTRRSTQLTSTPEDESSPNWSPDGEWVVFARSKQTSSLFLGDPETFSRKPLIKGHGEDFNPNVSKDGKLVAFFRRPPEQKSEILCVATLPEGEVKEFRFPSLTLTAEQWPIAWSPDGSEVAVPADDGSGNVDIYRVSVADGRARRVTIAAGVDTNPSWSPDGQTIAYIRLVEGGIQIWSIPATGGLPRKISKTPGVNVLPAWSPDSRRIAYACNPGGQSAGGEDELWIAEADDSAPAERVEAMYESGKGNYPLEWTKDGRSILVQRYTDEGIAFFLVAADGSDAFVVGKLGKGENENFIEFTDRGKPHMDLCFPGGVYVFADGEEISNIYKIRVPEIMEARLQAVGDLN